MDFSGRTAVVTGAASGMGRATSMAFGNAGANVVLFDLNEDGAGRIAKQIDGSGERTMVCRVDMAEPAQVRTALRTAQARFGRIDCLANVAAIYNPRAKVPDVTEDFWDRLMSVNLRGVFFCCQEALRLMVEQGRGAIVNVASGAAFRPIEGLVVYTATKAGLVGMTRVLALEHARTGVRVNVMAPGHTLSETMMSILPPEEVESMGAALVPGRWLTPEEPAQAILWLCSDEASGVNGAIINVNGGNHMPQG
jgi:NAD(P)-dependent dehydrogenase (short-subunit alcohol dehydrogenase family)